MSPIKIVIADNQPLLREGLKSTLARQHDILVVGEAENGSAAIRLTIDLQPHVLVLDLAMLGVGPASTIARVHVGSSLTRILVFAGHDEPVHFRASQSAGAEGYLLKSSPASELVPALRRVAAGETFLDPRLEPVPETDPPRATVEYELSRREREALDLLVRGHTNQEVADRMYVGVKTVETYRARIRLKTGLRTRAEFVRYGVDAGLLTRG